MSKKTDITAVCHENYDSSRKCPIGMWINESFKDDRYCWILYKTKGHHGEPTLTKEKEMKINEELTRYAQVKFLE